MPEQAPLTAEQKKVLQEKLQNLSPEELKQLQQQQCIFCQIVSGKIPSKKIYEDEQALVILDINPAVKGHLLLLPKEHYAIMPQVPEAILSHLFTVSKRLSQLLLRGLKASGTTIFIANGLAAGQRAQHLLVHIIPRKEADHLLEVEEKVVDEETRTTFQASIENRFNELIGLKKQVVPVAEKKPESKMGKSKVVAAEDSPRPKPVPAPVKVPSLSKTPASSGKKKSAVPKPIAQEKVSLDDIASLFK